MTEKLKPARDVWLIDDKDRRILGIVVAEPTGNGGNSPVAIVLTKNGHGNTRLAIARADLIAEAGTVHHECGLSPRELLDGYRELREALKIARESLDAISDDMTVGDRWSNAGEALLDALEPTRAALAKHKDV